ncbi:MAG: hypothetical protein HRU03_08530 [Nanoarchaeales archaeon]|nr:hypothetical protein [Nanoarchaeales archaeon]
MINKYFIKKINESNEFVRIIRNNILGFLVLVLLVVLNLFVGFLNSSSIGGFYELFFIFIFIYLFIYTFLIINFEKSKNFISNLKFNILSFLYIIFLEIFFFYDEGVVFNLTTISLFLLFPLFGTMIQKNGNNK